MNRHKTPRQIIFPLLVFSLLSGCTMPPSTPILTLPTGINYVDEVIAAVQSENMHAIKDMYVLSTVPCTTKKEMLRQPLCIDGETEGTLVQTMPVLSSDLGQVRINRQSTGNGFEDVQLYAVYKTGPYTYADEYFPAGEYAIAFVHEGSMYATIYQVTSEGIVRVDFCGVTMDICHGGSIERIYKEYPSAFILGPIPIDDQAR